MVHLLSSLLRWLKKPRETQTIQIQKGTEELIKPQDLRQVGVVTDDLILKMTTHLILKIKLKQRRNKQKMMQRKSLILATVTNL